jgi:hypothetical protein
MRKKGRACGAGRGQGGSDDSNYSIVIGIIVSSLGATT